MTLKFLFPYWGSEKQTASSLFEFTRINDFDGIEINLPNDEKFITDFNNHLDLEREGNSNFICVLQQVFGSKKESPIDYLSKVLNKLNSLFAYQPEFINSHTGKDHYSFDDNCRIIDAIENAAAQNNVPVYHEIHRGRFTFHSAVTLKYLEKFPNLKLVGDFSHWCVVSESLLEDQEEIIKLVVPHIAHLHARVGTEQASQVTNPFAPEWADHLDRFTKIWTDTLSFHKALDSFTVTPEFGPFPYMPQEPFTKLPLANQLELNLKMKDHLKLQLR